MAFHTVLDFFIGSNLRTILDDYFDRICQFGCVSIQ